jgi:hypothetical protein
MTPVSSIGGSLPLANRRAALVAVAAGLAGRGHAQTAGDDAHVVPEVLAARLALKQAAQAKNRTALEKAYAARFQHWRDSGRFQPRAARIDEIMDGVPLIETTQEGQLVIHPFGPGTAVATGVSDIAVGGKSVTFNWLAVYVKLGGAWVVAMSTSNRLARG